jgi:ribosome-binding factor A
MIRILNALLLFAAVSLALRADTQHFRWQEDNFFSRMDLEMRGTVEFTDNDADVKSISSDGYFRLEQWSSGPARTYLVRPGSNGIERLYSVDGVSKALDADGRAWLARILPEVIRESAVGAPERVKRILRQQGAAGVLAEVGKIRSDHSRRVYLENLLDYGSLNGEDLRESMRLGRKISSDGEKAGLLIATAPHYQTPATRESFFDTADSISSDGEHRRVLASVLERYGPDRETLALALRSAKRISSDGEKAAVLIQAADFRLMDDTARTNYFRAADSISSDGEHAKVLSTVLKKNADKDILVRSLRSASGISSDGEKCAVLTEAAAVYVDDAMVRRAFFDTAGTISSDGERHHALSALLKKADWSADTLREVAKSASRMSSDGEKAAVLVSLASALPKQPEISEALMAAADSINSDGEHAKVLMAALNTGTLSRESVVLVIHSAERISSDGEKAQVLARVAQRYAHDPQVASALRSAAKSISSDGEYRRVMAALDRGNTL